MEFVREGLGFVSLSRWLTGFGVVIQEETTELLKDVIGVLITLGVYK